MDKNKLLGAVLIICGLLVICSVFAQDLVIIEDVKVRQVSEIEALLINFFSETPLTTFLSSKSVCQGDTEKLQIDTNFVISNWCNGDLYIQYRFGTVDGKKFICSNCGYQTMQAKFSVNTALLPAGSYSVKTWAHCTMPNDDYGLEFNAFKVLSYNDPSCKSCDLTCRYPKVIDKEKCKCVCSIQSCDYGFILDDSSCSCIMKYRTNDGVCSSGEPSSSPDCITVTTAFDPTSTTSPIKEDDVTGELAESLCSNEYNPVCGINGKTYPNECYASVDKVVIANYGICEDDIIEEDIETEIIDTTSKDLDEAENEEYIPPTNKDFNLQLYQYLCEQGEFDKCIKFILCWFGWCE